MRKLFRTSKWIHKYLGLALLLFLTVEGISGILLNHPNLIRELSVPRWLIPPSYELVDWNRSAMRGLRFEVDTPTTAYAWGDQGVWRTTNGGETFAVMERGFPSSAYDRRTYDLLLLENGKGRLALLAATNAGLYTCSLPEGEWRPASGMPAGTAVKKILCIDGRLMAFTKSHLYVAPSIVAPVFRHRHLARVEVEPVMPLFRFVFKLHSGELWHLPGKLFMDGAGLVLVFLSLSGMYMWYVPWRRKRERKQGRRTAASPRCRQLMAFFVKYHLKLGMWVAVFFGILATTGLFMRPPLIMALSDKAVPKAIYPGPWPENPWEGTINQAFYNTLDKTIVIESDGFWRGRADLSAPFEAFTPPVDTSPMGAKVLTADGRGRVVVGSFGGLWSWELSTGEVEDLIAGEPYQVERRGPLGFMVSGYFETPEGQEFVVGFEEGIKGLDGAERNGHFAMPPAMVERYRMPLWSFLFELHNGRLFRDYIGGVYMLIPIFGALAFGLITVTGVVDWCIRAWRKRVSRLRPVA